MLIGISPLISAILSLKIYISRKYSAYEFSYLSFGKSLCWGVKVGLLSGFLWGLLQVVLGNAYYLAPIQFLIEYFLAFAFVGFAGLFYKTIQTHFQSGAKKKALLWVVIATLVGSLARYFWHFVAGVVFWGEYAPEGMSPVIYSLIVNGVTMIGAFVLCSAVLVLLLAKGSRIIRRKDLTF